MGTFAYMAPDSASPLDEPLPIRSLCRRRIMFVLMTNQNPAEIFSEEVQDRLMEGFEPELKAFIQKACHFNAKERHADSVEMAAALRELKTKIAPLPEDALPVYAAGSELRPMKELSDNEISVVQEQWHTFCHTTSPSAHSRPPQAPNSSSVETMAFGGMEDEGDSNKIVVLTISKKTITLPRRLPPNPLLPKPSADTGRGKSSKGEQSAAFPVTQPAPPPPKSSMPMILGLIIGGAALAGGYLWNQERLEKEKQAAEDQKALEQRLADEQQARAAQEAAQAEAERLAALQTELSKKVTAVQGKDQKTILNIMGAPTWVITSDDDNSDWKLTEGSELAWLWKNQNCPPIQIEFKLNDSKEAYAVTQINDGWSNGESGCLEEGDYPSSKLPPDAFRCSVKERSKQCQEYTKPNRSSGGSSSGSSGSSSSSSASSGSACNTSAVGRLKVNSRPWSYVYLDGTKIGTKIDQETKACTHSVRMSRDGTGSKTVSLTVERPNHHLLLGF